MFTVHAVQHASLDAPHSSGGSVRLSGIRSVSELAAAKPQVVAAALTGVSLENAHHFIIEARRIAGGRTLAAGASFAQPELAIRRLNNTR
jgi:hypothetical protein